MKKKSIVEISTGRVVLFSNLCNPTKEQRHVRITTANPGQRLINIHSSDFSFFFISPPFSSHAESSDENKKKKKGKVREKVLGPRRSECQTNNNSEQQNPQWFLLTGINRFRRFGSFPLPRPFSLRNKKEETDTRCTHENRKLRISYVRKV